MSREVAVEVPAAIRFLPMIRWILPLLLLVVGLAAAPAPAAAQRQRLSMDPGWRFTLGDPTGAEQPAIRRQPVAPAGPPARLEHRRHATRGRSRRGPRGLLPYGYRLVPQVLSAAGRRARARGLARVRRRVHEQRRLDQRRAPGAAALRLHRLRLRRHPAPGARHQRGGRASGQLAPAQLPLVHRQRHLPARLADHRRPASRGPLGHLRDDPARRQSRAPTWWLASGWRTGTTRRAKACSGQ